MGTLQTLLAITVLIYVLCVIVQAIQEVVKSALDAKAETIKDIVRDFMGNHLQLEQVEAALKGRGLDVTALEHFNKEDFRHLLDGIANLEPQLEGVIASGTATFEQKKDNVAAAFEAARAKFQQSYTTKNKKWVIGLSFLVVLALNASVIRIYEVLAADQKMSQAIAGTASTITNAQTGGQNTGGTAQSQASLTFMPRTAMPSTRIYKNTPF